MRTIVLKSYLAIACVFVILLLAWFGLNAARVHYYNDAIEGRRHASRYARAIDLQEITVYPIVVLSGVLLIAGVCEVSRMIAKRISN